MEPIPSHILFPQTDDLALLFLFSLLQLNPNKRLTAQQVIHHIELFSLSSQALRHDFFNNCPVTNPDPLTLRTATKDPTQASLVAAWRRSGLKGREAVENALLSFLE